MNYLLKEGKLHSFEIYKAPVFKEVKNKDYVIWGYTKAWDGDTNWNNLQPDYYEWLYNSSSKHRAIVNRKTLFINGKGVKTKEVGLTLPEQIEVRNFAFKINNSGIVKKWALNGTKVGGFCYEVIQNKKGDKIEPHYVNIKNIRRSKPCYDEQGRLEEVVYYYTADWESKKPEENPDYTVFHPFTWGEEPMSNSRRYLVYVQEDEETLYPIPEYTAAIPYISADFFVANFVHQNTKNNFAGSYLINFYNGEPSEEQKAQIERLWKQKYHDTDNAGEPILSFNEDKDSGVEVTPLSSNGQDDRFINLNKQIREEIFSGHTVNPIVVGLEGNNGFSNNADENRTAVEDFQNYYVSGKQMEIEQHLNSIRAYNDIKGEVYIQRLDPIKVQFTESLMQSIYTVDELREMDGAEPLTEEQKTTVTKETETQFSKEEIDNQILYNLAISGTFKDGLQFIKSREVTAFNIEEAKEQEQEFLDAIEIIILRLLDANPNLPLKDIAKSVKRPLAEIEQLVGDLKEQGLINEDGQVTSEGQEEPDEIFTVYTYEKRSDVSGGEIIEGTRDFCRNLVNLSKFKVWTIEDINRMNNGMGLDVFSSRGGWRTIKGTDRHVPRCRHVWKSHIVRRKPQ